MNCPRYGCDLLVRRGERGEGFFCEEHGRVDPILHTNTLDLRRAQALIEIEEMVKAGKRYIFH